MSLHFICHTIDKDNRMKRGPKLTFKLFGRLFDSTLDTNQASTLSVELLWKFDISSSFMNTYQMFMDSPIQIVDTHAKDTRIAEAGESGGHELGPIKEDGDSD